MPRYLSLQSFRNGLAHADQPISSSQSTGQIKTPIVLSPVFIEESQNLHRCESVRVLFSCAPCDHPQIPGRRYQEIIGEEVVHQVPWSNVLEPSIESKYSLTGNFSSSAKVKVMLWRSELPSTFTDPALCGGRWKRAAKFKLSRAISWPSGRP